MTQLTHKALLAFVCCSLCVSNIYGQCFDSQSFIIPDDDNSLLSLIIDGVTVDDLAEPSQGVCNVSLSFEHQLVGDLIIRLVSPSGQSIELIGPTGAKETDLVEWDINFIPCSMAANPDPGISNTWNNNESWTILSTYTGDYYPYQGCLEDFNMGPVNGLWTLEILDNVKFDVGEIKSFSIEFCTGTGLACQQCIADAGSFSTASADTLILCENDPGLALGLLPLVTSPANYSYEFAIIQNDIVESFEVNPDLSNYPVGSYQICGFSYLTEQLADLPQVPNFSSLNDLLITAPPPICGKFTQECLNIKIVPFQDTVVIDTIICDSPFFDFNGEQLGSTGTYRRVLGGGCATLALINATNATINAVIENTQNIINCDVDSILLSGTNSTYSPNTVFNWKLEGGVLDGDNTTEDIYVKQSGTYWLVLQEGTCTDSIAVQITEDAQKPTIEINSSVITCLSPISDVDIITIPTAVDYLWTGPGGITSTLDDLNVSTSGTYSVRVTLSNGCSANATHEVLQDLFVPEPILEADTISCEQSTGEIRILNYNPDFNYSWSGPGGVAVDGNYQISSGGDYMLEILAPNGCSIRRPVVVEEDTQTSGITYNEPKILGCSNTSDTIVIQTESPVLTYSWVGPNGPIDATDSLVVSVPGNYNLIVETLNGCIADINIPIVEDIDVPQLMLSAGLISCLQSEVVITTEPSRADLDYIWTRNGSFFSSLQNPTVDAIGYFHVEATAPNGCVARDSINIMQTSEIPNVDFIYDEIDCNNPSTQIVIENVNPSFEYNWQDPDGVDLEGNSPIVIKGGRYVLEVVDPAGCPKTFRLDIQESTETPELAFDIPTLNCNSSQVMISPVFDDKDLVFEWTGPSFSSSDSSVIISEPGNYNLLVTSQGGCEFERPFEVNVDQDLPNIVTSDVVASSCTDDIFLEASSSGLNDSLAWFGPNGFFAEGLMVQALDPGSYMVKAISPNGCEDSTFVELTINNTFPVISFAPGTVISCGNLTTTVGATADIDGTAISWITPSGLTLDGESIITSEPGRHVAMATTLDGCRSFDTINVMSVANFPQLTVSSDTINCGESEGLLSFSTPDEYASLIWSSPSGLEFYDRSISVLEEGLYTIEVTTQEGCSTMDTARISYDEYLPVVDVVIGELSCITNSVELAYNNIDPSVRSEDLEVLWQGPNGQNSTEPVFIASGPGQYIAEINNVLTGCSIIKEFDVLSDDAPLIQVSNDTISCGEGKINLNVNFISQINNPRVEWTGPNGFEAFDVSPVIVEGGNYTVKVFGDNGCAATETISVVADRTEPFIFVDDTFLNCDNDPVSLNATTSDANANIQWYGPEGFLSDEISPTVTVAGKYFVQIEGSNGCIYIDSSEVVFVPVLPEFEAFGDTINCANVSGQLSLSGVEDDRSFEWTGTNFSSTETSPVINSVGTFTLTVTGENGCTDSKVVQIIQDEDIPTAAASTTEAFMCTNTEVQLSGLGSSEGDKYQYAWLTQNGNIIDGEDMLTPTVNATGEYTLVVTDSENGCSNMATTILAVTETDLSGFNFNSQDPSCLDFENGTISVSAVQGGVGPFSYVINDSDVQTQSVIENLSSGTYKITVKDSFGCEVSQSISLANGPSVDVILDETYEVYFGDSIDIESTIVSEVDQITSITWQLNNDLVQGNELSVNVRPFDFSEIRVEVITEGGCTATTNAFITVNKERDAYLANIFNPNSFGENAVYRVYTSNAVQEIIQFNVYDRWGSKVFYAENYLPAETSIAWDGTHLGQNVLPAVYVYMVELLMIDGSRKQLTGDLTLIR